MKPFKHEQQHDVKVDIPTEDLKDLINTTGEVVIKVVAIYMAVDTGRHILKTLIK